MTGYGTEAAPAGGPVDQATLRGLTRARRLTRDLADDLLTHLPDLGDIATQRALDTWVEQAADTLRALSDAMEERLLDLSRPEPRDDQRTHRGPAASLAQQRPPGAADRLGSRDRP